MSATGLMHTRSPLWEKSQNQEATRALVSLSPTHWNTGELDSNIYSTIDSTKDRFVSKIRRFLGRDDMGRRLNSPNWFSSLSDRFFLFYSILFDFRYFSKRLELRIPDLFSFVTSATSRMLSFNVSLSVFFLGNLARRWSMKWFDYQDWYILLLLFTPVHIHATYKNYTDMIDNKIWKKKKRISQNKLFPRLFLPIALPRETMTRLSNSTDSRSLPNAGPMQLKGGTNDKQIWSIASTPRNVYDITCRFRTDSCCRLTIVIKIELIRECCIPVG